MAKKSTIEKNERRKRTVQKYSVRRGKLKAAARDLSIPMEQRMTARQELALLPLDSNPIRIRNRCEITGRPRGYIRFFGLSRIAFRDLALNGQLPGVRKGSL